jgi:hypothetical protein
MLLRSSAVPTGNAVHASATSKALPSFRCTFANSNFGPSPTSRSSAKGRSLALVTKALRTKGNQAQKTSKRTDNDRVAEPVDNLVSSPNAYGALGLIYAALAVPAALFPHTAADFLFGAAAQPHDFLHEPLFRILSSGLLTAGITSLALRLGARSGDLDSRANKRLEIGLIVFVTVNVLLQTTTAAQPDSVLTFPGFWSAAAVFGLTIAAAWGGYGKASEYGLSLKRAGPLPALKNFQDDTAELGSTARNPNNINSVLYALLTVNFFAAGVGYLYAPTATLEAVFSRAQGPECIFLWRAIGAALVSVVPTASYSLKEASDDGSLGDAPFKLLNVGLSGAALAHVLVLAPLLGSDTAGPFLPALLGVWGTALAVSGINLLKSGRD